MCVYVRAHGRIASAAWRMAVHLWWQPEEETVGWMRGSMRALLGWTVNTRVHAFFDFVYQTRPSTAE